LPKICRAAADIAADQVRIGFLKFGGASFVTRKNAVTKTWCEPLDLGFDFFGDVNVATERYMRVSPERMLPRRRTRFIKHALLCHEHEWTLGQFARGNVALGSSDFFQRTA
jgi:hypothetical protein